MTRNRTFAAALTVLLAVTVLSVARPGSARAATPAAVTALAPSVLLYSDDPYRPFAAADFITASTLRWAHDSACADDQVAARGAVDATRLGSGGYRHSTATGFPGCHANDDSYSSTDKPGPAAGRSAPRASSSTWTTAHGTAPDAAPRSTTSTARTPTSRTGSSSPSTTR